ncbi:hypothetical protein K788_0002203 [Paraburkholderia caribensis MBA4]|uniref:Uncharacterized protein n=1 Tax=Paraburkholderia caribensis MBA4 TaxID=1323664 RepID=A0A0P0R9E4_9BURK|nr:hypothetical protein K788_0002203 [Paraburkholderia caribensis MBA4]
MGGELATAGGSVRSRTSRTIRSPDVRHAAARPEAEARRFAQCFHRHSSRAATA